ncbi:hypothetical protein [Accumulibacter sp.]|uniref:hypothetical protein n=1 Tax=Accumulibacter sp. TaxID=2053492 RepID=UPI0028C4AB25|nr:hypothetical protein [Accumulibacter sp.]
MLLASWRHRLDDALAASGGDTQAFSGDLRRLVSTLQGLSDRQAFAQCRHCGHFFGEDVGYRCGLSSEPLAVEQTIKLCREWTATGATS